MSFPASLGSLTELQTLNISRNLFTNGIPNLTGLKSIQTLDLS